jgi:tyrosine-protein kinase Etk/Wzc
VNDISGNEKSVLKVALAWRKLVYRVFIAAAVLSVGISLLMPNWYAGRSTFLPPQESDARSGFLQLSSLLGIDLGGMGLLSDTPLLDVMIGVLKSRRLRAELVDQFDLTSVYGAETREHIFVNNTAEGLIEVMVEAESGELAAAMTNALVDLLDTYNRESSVEQARRMSEFITDYLAENEARLEVAARAAQEFQEEHGAIELNSQTRVTVEAVAELQARRTTLEIERGVLEQYASPDQTRMVEIEMELAQLDGVLERFTGESGDEDELGVFLPLGSVPKVGFELAQLTRDVMVYEKIQEYLAAQHEQSRIQEARDLQTIRIVDVAVPPLKKARPRRSVIVILTVALSSIAAVGLAFACEGLLAREQQWTRGDLKSAPPEIRMAVRTAHRLARWGGVE